MSGRAMGVLRGATESDGGVQNAKDCLGVARPVGGLARELMAARGREPVVLGAAVVLGAPPLGGDPAARLHAMKRGVERSFLDPQRLVGPLANPARDVV